MMIEYHHDADGSNTFSPPILRDKIGSARRAAIVEHNVVGDDVDDLADFDAFAVGVARDDLWNGVHPYVA